MRDAKIWRLFSKLLHGTFQGIEDLHGDIFAFPVRHSVSRMAHMAMDIDSKPPVEGSMLPQRRKIKTSELPLNATQRSSIDSLLHTIKKKGEFDSVRKRVWSQYAESVSPGPTA